MNQHDFSYVAIINNNIAIDNISIVDIDKSLIYTVIQA